MPISSLANLLLAAGLPKISPSTLPSLDFTFRPSVLAGAGSAFELVAAGAAAAFELVAAGGGPVGFFVDAPPKSKPTATAGNRRLFGVLCFGLFHFSPVVVLLV